MFIFGLRHRWFPKNAIGSMKNWVEDNRESKEESYCLVEPAVSTTYGDGFLITSGESAGISAASVLYKHLGNPVNLIFCSLQDENTIWMVIAKDGILYGDHIIKIMSGNEDSQQQSITKLVQDIERFDARSMSSDGSVTIVCNDVIQSDDGNHIELVGEFRFKTPYTVDVKRTDFDINILSTEKSFSKNFGLILSSTTKFPVDERYIKALGIAATFLIGILLISLVPSKPEPIKVAKNKPPVVIDNFKGLKKLLTSGDKAVGIKQRFSFIVNELNAARNIEGYRISKYTANQEASSITLKRTFGSIEAVKAKLPESAFYYQPTGGGLSLYRVTPTFPVFKTAVRANTYAEEAWIESALLYAWPDHIGELKAKPPVKNKKGGKYTAYEYSIPFNEFYLEDLENMSSLFVGRSASFEELNFTVDDKDKSYSGELKIKIIGVPDESFGIKKR